MSYLSVAKPSLYEKVIEKSRFLTYVAHTEDEAAARAFLAEVRAQHPLATHVCYAFVADRIGNLMRFSDDGEPQGTAGMPILGVIRARKLFETGVAVVRYFGGIKLGAGGLTRAYSSSAAEALERAEICEYAVCVEVTERRRGAGAGGDLRIRRLCRGDGRRQLPRSQRAHPLFRGRKRA